MKGGARLWALHTRARVDAFGLGRGGADQQTLCDRCSLAVVAEA